MVRISDNDPGWKKVKKPFVGQPYHTKKTIQETEERLQNKARERYQNLSKEEKEETSNMVMNATIISQKMKNNVEENIMEWEKCFIIIIRKYFNLANFAFL